MSQVTQAKLTFSEYQYLAEQGPIMIWRSTTTAECDYFNQRWLEFTGRTIEEETGNGWVHGVHPCDIDQCLAIYLTAFKNRVVFETEYRLRRHDGEYRWVLDRGVPFDDADGNFAGYIGSCIDVTETVQAREVLKSSQHAEVRQPRSLLPICSSCKAIRDDQGYWNQLESYFSEHFDAIFSHGLCPVCARKLYPDFFPKSE
jgi:PAS domain S-box-containing protein